MKRLISVHELSETLGLSINTIYAWINQKKVPYIKMGRLVKFDIQTIDKWIEEKTVSPMSIKERNFG